jgi:hypothetical protein
VRPTAAALRVAALASACVILGACPRPARDPASALDDAQKKVERGEWRAALLDFDVVAARVNDPPRARVRAWIGAALACQHLADESGARRRLEAAVAADLAGESEPAMFYLADLLRVEDRARALNLYYRAAAGAEKNRAGGFPYRAATDRILELSMSR